MTAPMTPARDASPRRADPSTLSDSELEAALTSAALRPTSLDAGRFERLLAERDRRRSLRERR